MLRDVLSIFWYLGPEGWTRRSADVPTCLIFNFPLHGFFVSFFFFFPLPHCLFRYPETSLPFSFEYSYNGWEPFRVLLFSTAFFFFFSWKSLSLWKVLQQSVPVSKAQPYFLFYFYCIGLELELGLGLGFGDEITDLHVILKGRMDQWFRY